MSKDPPDNPRPKDCSQQVQSESRKKLTESMLKNLNEAAKEARRGQEIENRYPPLSAEARSAVLDDLKEHLALLDFMKASPVTGKIQ
jgi:hypothetical protein